MKKKPMKRLPPDWGERLTLGDIDEILAHFRERLCAYTHGTVSVALFGDDVDPMPSEVPIVQKRIKLWTMIREVKEHGELVMPYLRAALQE